MKNLSNLKNAKVLTKNEQQSINGGQYCNSSSNCPKIPNGTAYCHSHKCYYMM